MKQLFQLQDIDEPGYDIDVARINEAYNLLAYEPPMVPRKHGKHKEGGDAMMPDWPKAVSRLRGGVFMPGDPAEFLRHVTEIADIKREKYSEEARRPHPFVSAVLQNYDHAVEIARNYHDEWDRIYRAWLVSQS